jgi:hypothetical protein
MASSSGTLETLALQAGKLLQPLESLLGPDFFVSLGAELPREITGDATLLSGLSAASSAAGALESGITSLSSAIGAGNAGSIIAAGASLINSISNLITALVQVGNALSQAANSLDAADKARLQTFAPTMASRTMEYMLVGYLQEQLPTLGTTLAVVGLIDQEFTPAPILEVTNAPQGVVQRRFYFERITQLFSSPADYMQQTFGWGSNSFDGTTLLPKLQALLVSLGVPAAIYTTAGQPPELEAYFFGVQADESTTPPGLKLEVSLPGSNTFDQTVNFSTLWQGTVHVQANYAAGVSATLKPPFSFSAQPPSGNIDLDVTLGLQAQKSATDPIVLVGVPGGSQLSVTAIGASVGVNASLGTNGGAIAPEIGFQLTGGKLFIDMSEADGFLSDLTSGTPIQATFALAGTWAPDTGLHITGGAQLEIDLPLHLELGPVTIDTVYVIVGLAGSGLTLELSAALGAILGPIQVSVDRVGILGTLTFPSQGGNLGPANLTIAFKPPNGLGLAIDAGVVTGGGYISFNPTKGQYAGILQMSLVDTIGITVIGVIDTIMPDGSTGFSFILIITFTLPPIQLGFGFTLNGVGGLGGVNRGIDTNALQAGFKAHTLDAVMFPPDPIDNAPQIISDIESFFPIAQGNYIFGPLLEIGWGEPTLITFTVGVILSIPNPIIIVILGLIDAGLPTQDEALIEIHIEVLGVIDFGTKTLSIDGTMYDSSVLIYALAGDLALRLAWGSTPNFLYSLGGFNPNFNTDGLDVPQMVRLSVSLGSGDNPRISSNSYFAVTSNTVQFGANVQAYASAGGFSIQGYLGFDVLIIISPFSFEFDFNCSFDVAYDGTTLLGLNVDGLFQGPTPWHFHGTASIDILFFSVSASVDLTWGSSNQATIPSKPVLPDLFTALANPQDWSAALPASTTVGVSFATKNPNDQTLCVHPMGTLQIKEKVVPLDLPITMYGNATPSDGTEFSIQSVQINSQTEAITPIQDYFAPGQFLTLQDADKLSTPSFELYDAGVDIGSSAVLNGQDSPRTVAYNEYYIYDLSDFSQFSRIYQMPANIHLALSAQGAGFTSPAKNTGLGKYSAGQTSSPIRVNQPQYVVTSVDDLSVRSDIAPGAGTSYFQAKAALSTYLATNPSEMQNLQIIPLHEVPA